MRENKNTNKEDSSTSVANRKKHTPNFYPVNQRFACLIVSIILLVYAIICIYYDDFLIPGKRKAIRLHGYSASVMFLAFIAAAANLLSLVIDHYDKRNNEHKYERFKKASERAGWLLLFSSMIIAVLQVISKNF